MQTKISVIIVNYNVKDFLEQALISLKRALKDISSQIIVVDNASIDGSVQMLKERFPDVKLIENPENAGFSAGNNIGLDHADGDFIVLLNPDTVVQEDTFSRLLEFFDKTPDASAATCKILNPDGTFSIDCRHSVPSPAAAFWKLTGLSRLFPKSKIFGRYNLTYLDVDETYQVEAVSGSFMMMRTEIVKKVGRLDEDFFMYCEDIDYCHRINQAGGKIYYVPDSQIIHYKGESTKKNNLDYVITFNRSLYSFYKKHFQQKYISPFKWLILLGVILRGAFIFLRNNISLYYPLVLDVLFLNLTMFFFFWLRYTLKARFSLHQFFTEYIIINVFTTIAFIISSLFFISSARHRYTMSKIIKANLSTFIFISAIIFFFKQFAFSRFVVMLTAIASPFVMAFWRLVQRKLSKTQKRSTFLLRPALIVGFDEETEKLLNRIKTQNQTGLDIIGLVSDRREDVGRVLVSVPAVTSLDQLPEYLRLNDIDLVIFTTHKLSYQSIITAMSKNKNQQVEFKMVPGHLEFIVGKSTIDRLDEMPLLDISYDYGKLFNRFIKRSFDFCLAFLLFTVFLPLIFILSPILLIRGRRKNIFISRKKQRTILWYEKNSFFRFILHLFNILSGKISFIGAPFAFSEDEVPSFEYKPGLTGLVQINQSRISDISLREEYELHYLKNHSFFLDLEILFKSRMK